MPTANPGFLEAGASRAELLLLGVFHFADQGLDDYKPRFRLDISSPERQREIQELVERLALFRPTTIAVEAVPSLQPRLDSLYSAYNAGTYQLGANEVYQVGFRLAKHLGLSVGAFKLGPEADYLGPDDATSWYNRNLRIFSDLQHLASGPEDRILLIIGAGHLPILRFLAQSSPEYRLRDPAEFITPR